MSSEDNDENISDTNDAIESDTVISNDGGSDCTCSTVLSHGNDKQDDDVSVKADLPTPNNTENHDEFMGRCMADPKMNSEFPDNDQRYAVCMTQHEGHEFPEAVKSEEESSCGCATEVEASEEVSCPVGSTQIGDTCVPVTVVCEVSIDKVDVLMSASTGKSVVRISGVAFTGGMNKNKWSLTREGAENVVKQMVGGDVTLNHPESSDTASGFSRNMEGGVDEAVVGVITDASIKDDEEKEYKVRYSAEIVRKELFSALESGLWLRGDYGVSIGGYGVPILADDDGMVFGSDFTFDHLAIVHRPAYEEASIEKAELIKTKASVDIPDDSYVGRGTNMSDQVDEVSDEEIATQANEIEALKAELILAQATIDEFHAAKEAQAEEERQTLVTEASEIGLKGHEDLSSETIQSLIASWREAHPEPQAEVFAEAKTADPEAVVEATITEMKPVAVVSNYLNGNLVETEEGLYSRAYNAWASAWNSTLSADDRVDGMRAKTFEELKEQGIVGPRGVIG